MIYDDLAQMQINLNVKLSLALDNTLNILLEELKRIIDTNVYGVQSTSDNPWTPNRTGQFLDSWQATSPIILDNLVSGEISQAIEMMQQFFIGNVEVHEDRYDLADIIESGSGYNFGQMEGTQRQFWDEFMIFVTVNLDTIFMKECIRVDLPIQKATIL